MTYRFELKSFGTKSACKNFIIQLTKRGLKSLYPKRFITSEYFDNAHFTCVVESQEGTVPRKKLRVRFYTNSQNLKGPNKNTILNFETKISSPEGRYKTVKKIDFLEYLNLKKNGFFVSSYGRMMPSLRINYLRQYFKIDGIRVTFDSKITMKRLRENLGGLKLNHQNLRYCILELKSDTSDSNLVNTSIAGLRLQRISKYADSFYKI